MMSNRTLVVVETCSESTPVWVRELSSLKHYYLLESEEVSRAIRESGAVWNLLQPAPAGIKSAEDFLTPSYQACLREVAREHARIMLESGSWLDHVRDVDGLILDFSLMLVDARRPASIRAESQRRLRAHYEAVVQRIGLPGDRILRLPDGIDDSERVRRAVELLARIEERKSPSS